MTMVADIFPRAFAVHFRDLNRWDPSSFHRILWHWPASVMCPLGSTLKVRKEKVDRTKVKFSDLQPITIHFDGSIDRRKVDGNREYTMDLFVARPGDIVVAKIDLKNGAVGIVPEGWDNVVVTGHFAVYEPDRSKLISKYLNLVIQTKFFKAHLWRNKVGAEGRKEVKLDFFEAELIPLPPLPMQQKIVAEWEASQKAAAETTAKIEQIEREIEARFLAEQGLKTPPSGSTLPKYLIVRWRDSSRWDFPSFRRVAYDPHSTKHPNVCLRELVHPLRETTRRVDPKNSPNVEFNYLGMENVEACTGAIVDFTPRKGNSIKSSCVCFDKGHVLYGKLRPYLRKVVDCSELPFDTGIASSEFLSLRPKNEILQSWLAFLLRSSAIAEQAKVAIGARMPRIAPLTLLDFITPFPPFYEQVRIMAHVNEQRKEIVKLKAEAKTRAEAAKADVEAMILGTKKVRML
jgi:restriction endonuclease S subunit